MVASVVCVVILSMLLITDRIYRTLQEKQIWFNRAITMFILYFISDAFWAAVLSGQLPRTRFLVVLFNLTNFVLMSLMSYEWFMFMAASEKMAFRTDRKKRLFYLLPMLATLLILLISYALNPYFWISESGELCDLYYPLMLSAPTFYLLLAFVFSMINARKAENKDEKRQYCLIGIFPLGVIACGLVQLVVLNAPTFCFGCTLMWLWFYIQNLQTMISVDALTRLNNRGQISRYMEQFHYRENAKAHVMMIDIDNFKQINDTFGHAEGDHALILVSEALKLACEPMKSPVFLGRFGGDEFIVILQNPEKDESPEQTAQAIRRVLMEKQQENRLPYGLNVSIGHEALQGKSDTLQDCMIRADEKLYNEKRAKGAGR